ncbi:glycosyltransferase family 39 protein [Paenibacillus sp. E194]|uniref:glycosyltransferase family 39 protein n=1 Tax=Paenibacillus sp. E194 TaxID=1458845 RepID=UPI000695FFDF|nr:glycosyltransferase family 39 protein [Paenibacillus sp. E194]
MDTTYVRARLFTSSALFLLFSFILGIVFFLVQALFGYDPTYREYMPLVSLLYLGSVFLLTYYSVKQYSKESQFIFFIACLSFFIRLVWILTIDTQPMSDFQMMYDSAIKMANGDFSYNNDGYFLSWTYQLGFTMYQALIIKIFGSHLIILKFLNVLFCTGTTVLIYKIALQLFNDFSAKFSSITFCFFIPNIIMSSVLSNQHLATFLFYLGFYLIIEKLEPSKKTSIIAGAIISVANLMRPLGSMIILCIIIYYFFYSY